ncbi:hypothetical protein [Paludibacterium yongneupense]|uniref:hypothetical protein n=1 Tax=Paludibacterium yongneupense TaxID=400061 RepID=UPI000417C098|nr:hypothetical protein [Paludibacterium yongneupense]
MRARQPSGSSSAWLLALAKGDVPGNARFAASLLILREFMHRMAPDWISGGR